MGTISFTAADPDKYYTSSATSPNVTNATTEILAANYNRKYLLLINDSDNTIYLGLGVAAVLNDGIRLGTVDSDRKHEMSARMGNLFKGAINALHGGTGNKVILIVEGT